MAGVSNDRRTAKRMGGTSIAMNVIVGYLESDMMLWELMIVKRRRLLCDGVEEFEDDIEEDPETEILSSC